ncbi:hypothetical protein F5B22DRAFT_641845 [Xylaria bambusicola]|uniref:uncharacterized protein n=1 Tax=Xylaria bambusicola TaxID=326684 RepID=UPI002008104F|nr:uncharacterized protein F5B22DRAFT_641845 [Xylaria bambusicola]KAI0526705.1 hypothetical protein F5B22DRAFT_641845 [Xylaria bambusicola]
MAPQVTPELLRNLSKNSGPDVEILVDKNSSRFKEQSKRWTDIDRDFVFTISHSEDILCAFCHQERRTQQSTIGEHGIVVDLSKYSAIRVDANARTATLAGSILCKDVAVALAAKGFFTGDIRPPNLSHYP